MRSKLGVSLPTRQSMGYGWRSSIRITFEICPATSRNVRRGWPRLVRLKQLPGPKNLVGSVKQFFRVRGCVGDRAFHAKREQCGSRHARQDNRSEWLQTLQPAMSVGSEVPGCSCEDALEIALSMQNANNVDRVMLGKIIDPNGFKPCNRP